MTITNLGVEKTGSWFMGLSPDVPTGSMAFGIIDTAVQNSDTYLGEEVLRKLVTWSRSGDLPRASVTISRTEANGSSIVELGLCKDSTVGSDLWSRDLSAIGSKTEDFAVNITMDLNIVRG